MCFDFHTEDHNVFNQNNTNANDEFDIEEDDKDDDSDDDFINEELYENFSNS